LGIFFGKIFGEFFWNFFRENAERSEAFGESTLIQLFCLFSGMCQNGVCMNTIGSFHCECYPGYVYDEDSHQCIDKNECLQTEFQSEERSSNPCQGIGTPIKVQNKTIIKITFCLL
jgi:hypothetical protein